MDRWIDRPVEVLAATRLSGGFKPFETYPREVLKDFALGADRAYEMNGMLRVVAHALLDILGVEPPKAIEIPHEAPPSFL